MFVKTKSEVTYLGGSEPSEYTHILYTCVEPPRPNHVYENQVGNHMHTKLHAGGYQVKKPL